MAGNIKLIGAVGIKVRPDTSEFKDEIKDQIKNLPEYKLEIGVDGDLAPFKRAVDKARKEEEAKKITLHVGVDYDSINAARNQVKNALAQLKLEKIPVEMDEGKLNEALRKLDRLRRSAKVDMEINEDKAGYQAVLNKIRAIQREKIAQTITFKTDNKSLRDEARKYEKLLADLEPKRTITIHHRNDHASLTAAIKEIDEAIAKLKEAKVTSELNEPELLKERDKLQNKLNRTPLELKVNDDIKGYKSALDKVLELQRIAAAETIIKFKTDEAGLARQAKALQKKIAALTPKEKVTFSYASDTFGLQTAINEVDQKLKQLGQIKITADLDEKGLRDAKRKLEELYKKSSFEVKVNTDDLGQLERELQKVQGLLDDTKPKKVIEVSNDPASLEEAKKQLEQLVKDRKAKIHAEPITFLAAAQLAYTARARSVPFYVRVNERSVAIAEGVLQSLAGINTIRGAGRFVETMVKDFDRIALKVGGLGALFGSLTDTILYMGTALFPIGEGVGHIVGLLAMAPAMMAAITATTLINVAAWDGFKEAVDGSEEALAKLPPEAQKTALALRGTWEQIQKPVQASFWKGMGDAMATSFQAFIPIVAKGLEGAAFHVGQFGAGVFRAFEKLAISGDLQTMFSNLELMFDNASGAAEPLFDAINRIGLRGSEYLPQFGQWLTDISIRFDNWVKKADENGDINRWIEQGIASLENMWTLAGGIIKQFQAITDAARTAGASGLGDFAREMDRIGDMMKGEPFQSRLSRIFEGARDGASKFNVGVKELGTTLGESAVYAGNLLEIFGDLGGKALSGISKVLGNTTFQTGTLSGLRSMNEMADEVQSGFDDLGTVIGNLSTMAGAAFESIGPVINGLIDLLDIVVGTLRDNITEAIPGLMGMVEGLVVALQGPVQLVADILNNIIGFINSLPGPLSSVGLSMLAFVILAGKIGPIFAAKPGGFLERIKYDFGQADGARQKFTTGLKGIGAGLLGAVGGPWGIAMAAITTGIGLAGMAAAEQKAHVESLTATLDESTGAITRNTTAFITDQIVKQSNDGFYLMESGAKSASETLAALGKSVEDTGSIVANGGKPYEDMIALLREGETALEASGAQFDENGFMVEGNSAALEAWADKMNISKDAVSSMDLTGLIAHLESLKGKTDGAKSAWGLMNDTMAETPQRIADWNTQMGIYNDTTQTADTRVRALKDALDLLNGKQVSVEDSTQKVNDSMRAAAGHLQTVGDKTIRVGGAFRDANGKVANFKQIIDANTGIINTASDAGSNLRTTLAGITTNVLTTATAMKDAGAPVEEITGFLKTNRDAFINQGIQAGLSGDLVAAAYDHMIGANPKELITTITAQGVKEAEDKIANYKGSLEEIDAYQAVAGIAGDDKVLGVKLADSYTNLAAFDKVVSTATADLDPKKADAVRQKLITDLIALANTNPTVKANMDPRLLEERRRDLVGKLEALGRMKPTPAVAAETAAAKAQLETVNNLLRDIANKNGTSVTVGVHTQYTSSGNPPSHTKGGQWAVNADGGYYMDNMRYFANGGVIPSRVKQFANGGIENHVAQIARPKPGLVRVWAEEETEGEAYIPLAVSKRARSTQILEQVASQFGYNLTRPQAFADGGVVGAGSRERMGQVAVNIDSYIQQSNNTADDVARAIMRRVKSRGVYAPLEGF